MKELRRKILLPVFQLSELADQDDPRSIERILKEGKGHPSLTYRYRFVWDAEEGRGYNYNLFPVVLDRRSAPWAFGTLFILSQLEGETQPVMATFQTRADDLGAFKEWLDSQDTPEELLFHFPKPKLRRTTYRYRGFLQKQIQAREIGTTTAKRRMGTVISFYKWLISNTYFKPEYPAWEEKEYQLSFKTADGRQISKTVGSTDLSIVAPKAEDVNVHNWPVVRGLHPRGTGCYRLPFSRSRGRDEGEQTTDSVEIVDEQPAVASNPNSISLILGFA